MLLSLSGVKKSFGENVLFENVTFNIEKNDIIGLIGANGAGKTTLFKIITGEIQPDGGGMSKQSDVKIGYLQQHTCESSSKTAYEEVLTVFDEVTAVGKELDALNMRLETDYNEQLIEKQQFLNEKFEALGGLTYRALARSALAGLGFSEKEQELPTSALSGGQRSKIGLCKLLLSKPQIMLLDEPTNHLDIASLSWLEDYILGCGKAAVIISHDRYFLDRVTNRTAEIENGKFFIENGNYSRFAELKKERAAAARAAYENTMKEVHRIEGIIEQQRRWNREKNIKTAESREKQIERMTRDLVSPEKAARQINFKFGTRRQSGKEVLKIRGLSAGFDGKKLYSGVNAEIFRGDRVFVTGSNGCGKTTFLKQILTEVKNGDENSPVVLGTGVSIGYFDQHGADLDKSKTMLEEVHDRYPSMTETEVRNALAAFLFTGDDVFKKIEKLSGGERAKVALCKLMMNGDNLLMLDEPTNHLDISSRTALENALIDYDGTLLIVSHDRYFINRLATEIMFIGGGSAEMFPGNYDTLAERQKSTEVLPSGNESKPEKISAGGKEYFERKKRRSEIARSKTELSKTEAEIENLENEKRGLVDLMSDGETAADYQKMLEISGRVEEIDRLLTELTEKWADLSEFLENASND